MIDLKDWLQLQEDGLKAYDNKRYVQAENAFVESLKILQEQEKEMSADADVAILHGIKEKLALSLHNLAAIHQLQGKYSLALNEYIKSTDIYRRIRGENSLDFATSLHNLGMVYAAKKDFQQAEALFRRSLAIKEKQLRATHPELQAIKEHLEKVLKVSGQNEMTDKI